MDSELKLYNTLSRKLEPFHPLHDKRVGLYTCGPTVYATAHIGNLRTYIFEDVLRRTLELDSNSVNHVMNITDVGHLTSDADTGEDKMEQAAREQGRHAREIAAEFERQFWHDLKVLNVLPPHKILHAASAEPIKWQIALVEKLTTKGFTYQTSDGIYFDTVKFPRYGRLSGQSIKEKKAGARVEVRSEKRNPADFALWKFSPAGEKRQMEWEAFGQKGFPGWHLECSAISMHELGEQFDIHCGGIDHIAVHHENEIAQSEAASGQHPFVKYWLHGEFLVLPDKRMGKSEGNKITLAEVIDRQIDPLAFRYFVLQAHYRTPLTFSWEALEAAAAGLKNLQRIVTDLGSEAKVGCAEFEQRFTEAVNDDLNTAKALAVLQELLKSDYPNHAKRQSVNIMDTILGLGLRDATETRAPAEVQAWLDQREVARLAKDFKRSDALRHQIEQVGYLIEDTPSGARLRPK